jgi:hypothetical protein
MESTIILKGPVAAYGKSPVRSKTGSIPVEEKQPPLTVRAETAKVVGSWKAT